MTTPNWNDAIRDANEKESERNMQEFLKAAASARENGRSAPMTEQEKEDLEDYRKPGGENRWKARAKLDLDNRRANWQIEEEKENKRVSDLGLTKDSNGDYYDVFGRECDKNGRRY